MPSRKKPAMEYCKGYKKVRKKLKSYVWETGLVPLSYVRQKA